MLRNRCLSTCLQRSGTDLAIHLPWQQQPAVQQHYKALGLGRLVCLALDWQRPLPLLPLIISAAGKVSIGLGFRPWIKVLLR